MNYDFESILQTFGLKKYEAAVFISLVTHGSGPATEIAEISGVPLPRIYSILRSLEKRGYVQVISNRPSNYRAAHPGYVLRAELANLRKKTEQTLLEIEQDYETGLQKSSVPERFGYTTYGDVGFTESLLRLLQETKSSFVGAIHDLDWCVEESVLDILKKKRRARLDIRVIGIQNPSNLENLTIFKAASGAMVRATPQNEFKTTFAISDGTKSVVTLADPSLAMPDRLTTVFFQDFAVGTLLLRNFEELWSKATELGQ